MKTKLLLIVLTGLVWSIFAGISCADNWSITTTLDNGKSLYAEVSTGDISVLEGDICICNIQIYWVAADAAFIPTLIQDSTQYQVYQKSIRATIRHSDYADAATWQKSVQSIMQTQCSNAVNGFIGFLNDLMPKTKKTTLTIKSSSR